MPKRSVIVIDTTDQKRTYLFDFDGTLVDSMPTYISAMLRILDENSIAYGEDIVKIMTPLGLNGAAEYFINELGLNIPKDRLVALMKEYMQDAYFYTIPAKENVISVLQELKRRGASLNVLTASPHLTLDACLKRLEMLDLFDHVWSCDDFNTTKSNPDIYVRAAEKIGVPPKNVIFVDDNVGAVKTAKTGGMTAYGIYDETSEEYIDEMTEISDRYVRVFEELLRD